VIGNKCTVILGAVNNRPVPFLAAHLRGTTGKFISSCIACRQPKCTTSRPAVSCDWLQTRTSL